MTIESTSSRDTTTNANKKTIKKPDRKRSRSNHKNEEVRGITVEVGEKFRKVISPPNSTGGGRLQLGNNWTKRMKSSKMRGQQKQSDNGDLLNTDSSVEDPTTAFKQSLKDSNATINFADASTASGSSSSGSASPTSSATGSSTSNKGSNANINSTLNSKVATTASSILKQLANSNSTAGAAALDPNATEEDIQALLEKQRQARRMRMHTLPTKELKLASIESVGYAQKMKAKNIRPSVCTAKARSSLRAVRHAIKKLGWEEIHEETEQCSLDWREHHDITAHLTPWQVTSKVEGLVPICRKAASAESLNRMAKAFPKEYNFVPPTWVLRRDGFEEAAHLEKTMKVRKGVYVAKPSAGSQGKGVQLVKKWGDLEGVRGVIWPEINNNQPTSLNNPAGQNASSSGGSASSSSSSSSSNPSKATSKDSPSDSNDVDTVDATTPTAQLRTTAEASSRYRRKVEYVVQKYVSRPLCIDNLKFDCRVYIVITSVSPLKAYFYEEGLARFCTVPYEKPTDANMENACMHLTNYAVNKRSENFVSNREGGDSNSAAKSNSSSSDDDEAGGRKSGNKGGGGGDSGGGDGGDQGSKRSMSSVFAQLERLNKEHKEESVAIKRENARILQKSEEEIAAITEDQIPDLYPDSKTMWKKTRELCEKTLLAIKPSLVEHYAVYLQNKIHHHPFGPKGFQIIGLDIIFNEQCEPKLLELNANCSLSVMAPATNRETGEILMRPDGSGPRMEVSGLDLTIKSELIAQAMLLANPMPHLRALEGIEKFKTENPGVISGAQIFKEPLPTEFDKQVVTKTCRIPVPPANNAENKRSSTISSIEDAAENKDNNANTINQDDLSPRSKKKKFCTSLSMYRRDKPSSAPALKEMNFQEDYPEIYEYTRAHEHIYRVYKSVAKPEKVNTKSAMVTWTSQKMGKSAWRRVVEGGDLIAEKPQCINVKYSTSMAKDASAKIFEDFEMADVFFEKALLDASIERAQQTYMMENNMDLSGKDLTSKLSALNFKQFLKHIVLPIGQQLDSRSEYHAINAFLRRCCEISPWKDEGENGNGLLMSESDEEDY